MDTLLKRDVSDGAMVDYLLGVPYRDAKKDKNYSGLFTAALRDVVSRAEVEEVKKTCGGVYTGDLCGFGFDPILCAQDFPDDGVLYRLEYEDKNKAVITMRWPWIEKPLGTYTLIRNGKRWILDGILCRDGYGNFNFTDMDKIKGLTVKPREQ